MELIKIEIENYKSITESVSVEFHKNLPTVLIGKNGSGKSNILEALEHIAATNSNFPGKYGAGGLRYKAYLRLDNNEFSKLFPNEEYSKKKAEFSAYSSSKDGLHINTIESETIVPLLKKELDDVLELTNELEKAVANYEKALEKIACDDRDSSSVICYDIINEKGNTTNYGVLKFQSQFFIDEVKRLRQLLINDFKSENTFVFDLPRYTGVMNSFFNKLTPFKLRYKAPELAQFEQNFITINESAIKREITKINKKTENACEKVDEILNKLKIQTERLMDTVECGAITEFINKVTSIFGNNCAYLLSENSQVLFKDFKKENDNRYYNTSDIIFKAYAKSHNINTTNNDKNYVLTKKERSEFERWLNANLPKFDRGMYEKITVDTDEKNQLSIFIHENNKQVVSLNETSAGRRWYFTYYFVKNTLSHGDTFIIDEPASMLHPSAQKEILSDICEMTKNGIRVIYSTHSPYLIPENWSCVGFVSMAQKGTTVSNFDLTSDEFADFRAYSSLDVFSCHEVIDYFNNSKFKQYITRGIYARLVQKFSTNREIAEKLDIEERTVYYWQNAEKKISLNNVLKAAIVLRTDPLNLIKETEE